MKRYRVEWYGWIKSYRDFDTDTFECDAESEEDFYEKFIKHIGSEMFIKSMSKIKEIKND